ncbi:Urocanate hydratase [Fasciolopsis buskii]|uniref:Urocanate hydratase n=1 Tax=Fasciolopsis buskii TaxID=27845 RepID=A0A8E0RY12_9TREM|nr:Urocanate hydratase [Fasciolopsis buski]
MVELSVLAQGLPLNPLPVLQPRDPRIAHAPALCPSLDESEKTLALANALRYIPTELHEQLALEFAHELAAYGHIYMYRFRPDPSLLRAHPIGQYPAKCVEAAAIMLMICNNLDRDVAQFPDELVTYGGNGQVFSNWAQFWLVMKALSRLTRKQTLVLYSGHPAGLFPSPPSAPRMIITNGMLVPRPGLEEGYQKLFALGVTQYGQMTAGSFCYIGSQGIVHGTTLTILNAFRRYLGTSSEPHESGADDDSIRGRVFLSSGLGGMSGAQAKAAVITGCIGVIAEVSEEALNKRFVQGWLTERVDNLEKLMERIRQRRKEKRAVSIGYLGNVVDVWQKVVSEYRRTGERLIDIASDQTSCYSYEAARKLMREDNKAFRKAVENSLRVQVAAINEMSKSGVYFFDYGNAFLLQAKLAGADLEPTKEQKKEAKEMRIVREFRYPSYVQDIMGNIFSMGFGPFRWVCTSGLAEDLQTSDRLAGEQLERLLKRPDLPMPIRQQFEDNLRWIKQAQHHKLVVGSQARILYSDEDGRIAIAEAFNDAIRKEVLHGPIVISRDHHDVSGTDSPYRETANIYDGSAVCADMSVHNAIGCAVRGATWVSLHNGGGVGWGEVMNGGFGHVLDGTPEALEKAIHMLSWDVTNGITRRAWSGHPLAKLAIDYRRTVHPSDSDEAFEPLLPEKVQDTEMLEAALKKACQ